MRQVIVNPKTPYDFALMMNRPLSRRSALFAFDTVRQMYLSSMNLNDGTVVPYSYTNLGTLDVPKIAIEQYAQLHPLAETRVLSRLYTALGIDVDLTDFYQRLQTDIAWSQWMSQVWGLRLFVEPDPFASIVKTMIGQQLNVAFAATLVDRLATTFGTRLDVDGLVIHTFPSAQTMAGLTYEALQALQFSRRKAEYVIDIARTVVEGRLSLDDLQGVSDDEEVITRLAEQRGIGRWTAECFLLFALGRSDVFPANDIGVLNALKQVYSLSVRPSPKEARVMAESWRPWRSYYTYCLWQSLI